MGSTILNAFIRVSEKNESKNGLIIYSDCDIENIIKKITLCISGIRYYYIKHSADDEVSMTHWHLLFRFVTPVRFDVLKDFFPFGKIENAKNVKKCIQYLIHFNDLEKTQYQWSDIVTNVDIEESYKKSLVRDKLLMVKKKEDIIANIDSGKITKLNMFDYIDIEFYTKYKTDIDRAFEYVYLRQTNQSDRSIIVLFYEGSSGCGKTWNAKEFCKERNLSYYISSASDDFMQNYKGEDVLILDDMRDDMPFTQMLRLLDNNTGSSIKSRYFDKTFIGSYVILTSFKPLQFWYSHLNTDVLVQLYRRIPHLLKFVDNKNIEYYIYDLELMRYVKKGMLLNKCPYSSNAEKKSVLPLFDVSLDDVSFDNDFVAVQNTIFDIDK